MGIKFPSISLTRYTLLIAAQLIVNVSLALWLYNEYLHNPFMQLYMSDVWSAIWPVVIGATVGSAIAIFLFVLKRGSLKLFAREADTRALGQAVGSSESLTPIDVCPFCDVPLKTISEGRLQCRNCRRYFKSSLPKVPA